MKKIIVISIFVSFILSCDPICEYNIVFKNSSSKKASVYKNISSQSYSVDIVPNDQKLMKKLNSDIGCKMYYEIFDTVKIDFSDLMIYWFNNHILFHNHS